MKVEDIDRPLYLDMADTAEELGIGHATLYVLLGHMGIREQVCAPRPGKRSYGKCRVTAEHLAALKRVVRLRNELQISFPATLRVLAKADRDAEKRFVQGGR